MTGIWVLTNTCLDDFLEEASHLQVRTEIESIFRMITIEVYDSITCYEQVREKIENKEQ